MRLFFLGLKHPNPHVARDAHGGARPGALADELGLTGTHVFFNEDWVEYDDRQNYLLESDVGVSTHLDHVETAFSFRTRILDYLWAGLPVVSTAGDALADIIERPAPASRFPPTTSTRSKTRCSTCCPTNRLGRRVRSRARSSPTS